MQWYVWASTWMEPIYSYCACISTDSASLSPSQWLPVDHKISRADTGHLWLKISILTDVYMFALTTVAKVAYSAHPFIPFLVSWHFGAMHVSFYEAYKDRITLCNIKFWTINHAISQTMLIWQCIWYGNVMVQYRYLKFNSFNLHFNNQSSIKCMECGWNKKIPSYLLSSKLIVEHHWCYPRNV